MIKNFDAVAFQRKVREELSKEYLKDPLAYKKDLAKNYRKSTKPKRKTA